MRLIIILILFPTLINGQILTKDKISIELFVKPGYSYRFLSNNNDSYSKNETLRFNYQFGVNIYFAFRERFVVSSGMHFSNYALKRDINPYIFPDSYDPTTGAIDIGGLYKIISWSNYYFIDIPLNVKYYFLINDIKLYTRSGILLKNLISTNTKNLYYYSNYTDVHKNSSIPQTMNRIFLAYNIGCGIVFNINDNQSLCVEPNFDMMITPLYDSGNKDRLYSLGVIIGYDFKLF